MSTTTFQKKYYKAFSVNQPFLERLRNFACAQNVNIRARIWLSDASTIADISVDDVIAFDNMDHRRILRIDIDSVLGAALAIHISLNSQAALEPVEYRVSGNDKDATYVASEIEKLLGNQFQLHSYFSAMPPFHQGAWWMVLQGLWLFTLVEAEATSQPFWLLPGVVALGLATGGYGFLTRRIFPKGEFLIGEGIGRAEKLRSWRRRAIGFLFVVVVAGVLVNLAASILYDHYWKK
jgi:hypothetical protein